MTSIVTRIATLAAAVSALSMAPAPAPAATPPAERTPHPGLQLEREAWPHRAGPYRPHPPGAEVRKPRPPSVRDARENEPSRTTECLTAGAAQTPHAPIEIASDADLSSPASGVRGGSGTAADPYVISGWFISGQGAQLGQALSSSIYGPVTISGLWIHGTTKHVLITGNVIGGTEFPQGLDIGIAVEAPNVRVETNTICSTIFEGIFARGAPGVSIRQNRVVDARAGIWSLGSPEAAVVGNDVTDSVFGVSVEQGDAPLVIGNKLTRSFLTGAVVNQSPRAVVKDNVVTGFGAVAEGIGSQGINVYDSDEVLVSGNQIFLVGTHGLVVGYVQDGRIEGNRSVSNGLTGLFLWDDWVQGRNVVRGNELVGNGAFGPGFFSFRTGMVIVDTDANLVEDNVVSDNTINGVQIYATDDVATPEIDPTRDNVFRNQAASGSRLGFGFDLYGDAGTLLDAPRASGNAGGGVSLIASGATVRGGTLEDNQGAGVYLTGPGGGLVEDNLIRRNGKGAVVSYATGYTLRRNALVQNTRGFGMWGVSDAQFDNDVDPSNLVDGRPVLVLEGPTGTLDWDELDPGFLALVRPESLTVVNVDSADSVQGLVVFGGRAVSVEGARVRNAETGIALIRTSDSSVSGASVSESDTGIAVTGDSERDEVSGSTFTGVLTGVAIRWERDVPEVGFATPEDVTVAGNAMEAVAEFGIDNSGSRVSITGNTIGMAGGTGVLAFGAPILVEDNLIGGSGARGVEGFGSLITVRGNAISGFERGISGFHAEGITVEDNRLSGNEVGLYSTGAADGAKIVRNVVTDNQHGIQIYGEAWDVVAACNRVTGSQLHGMLFGVLTFYATVTGNLVEDNGGVGISFAGALSQINDNRIASNDVGVRMGGNTVVPSNPLANNNIEGNRSWGATVFTAGAEGGTVQLGGPSEIATNNWWGHASGPRATTNPTGTGDRVGDQVIYRNGAQSWLAAPDPDAGSCGAGLPA